MSTAPIAASPEETCPERLNVALASRRSLVRNNADDVSPSLFERRNLGVRYKKVYCGAYAEENVVSRGFTFGSPLRLSESQYLAGLEGATF